MYRCEICKYEWTNKEHKKNKFNSPFNCQKCRDGDKLMRFTTPAKQFSECPGEYKMNEKVLHKYIADTINKEFINSIAQGAADKILSNRSE